MDAELVWAGGLFEGEGCFSYTRDTRYPKLGYIRVTLAMTDEDAVRRFHAAVSVGLVREKKPFGLGTKTLYEWRVSNFEHAQAVVAMLWYGLNARRRARATEILDMVRESQAQRVNLRRPPTCSIDGCESVVKARLLCNMHDLRQRAS